MTACCRAEPSERRWAPLLSPRDLQDIAGAQHGSRRQTVVIEERGERNPIAARDGACVVTRPNPESPRRRGATKDAAVAGLRGDAPRSRGGAAPAHPDD